MALSATYLALEVSLIDAGQAFFSSDHCSAINRPHLCVNCSDSAIADGDIMIFAEDLISCPLYK